MPSSTTTNTTFRLGSSGYVSAASISKSGKEMRSSSESVGTAPTKPKQSKSRNGCVTCKAKRLKCDESKPTCHQCQKRGVPCGGYKKDFKWRPFEEASLGKTPKPARKSPGASRPKRSSPPLSSPEASFIASPTVSAAASQPSPSESGFGSPPAHQSQYGSSQDTCMHEQRSSISPNGFGLNSPFLLPLDSPSHITSPPTQSQPGLLGPQHTGAFALTTSPDPDNGNGMLGTSTEFGESTSADSASSLAPMSGLVPITSAPMQELMGIPSFGYPEPLYSPAIDNTIPTIAKEGPEENDEIEEVIRSGQNSQSDWMIPVLSPAYANSSSRSRSSRGEIFMSANDIFRRPAVAATSPEMLVLHFDKHTCGIMSVKDGPNENPWRTLIWPLAQDSPALYHAIASMTAFHMSGGKPGLRELRVEGMEHMRSSIRYLANDIRSDNTHNEAALATTLVLAFSEAFDRHTSTGIEHLRGAKVLVRRALDEHSTSRPDKVACKRLGFLYNVWVYLDVLARLTSDEDEDEGPRIVMNGPLTPISEIDPLLGCAATLFPLIGRVASLVQKVRGTNQNTYDIIDQGMEIKDQLEGWAPESCYDAPEDSSSNIEHCVKTAEAYRYATLLYLHQAVPELPSPGSRELARKVMLLIAEIPLTSRSCIVHIYPLLAAGCEAVTEEERFWVKSRWEGMCSRMWIGNVSKAREVMEEVWDRRDKFWESQEAMQRYSLSPTGARLCSPTLDAPVYERKVNPVGSEVEVYGWGRATLSENSDMRSRRRAMADGSSGGLGMRGAAGGNTPSDMLAEYEMSVKGKLHWAGVMKDWRWEVLLG